VRFVCVCVCVCVEGGGRAWRQREGRESTHEAARDTTDGVGEIIHGGNLYAIDLERSATAWRHTKAR
jgi:hypothetical protein